MNHSDVKAFNRIKEWAEAGINQVTEFELHKQLTPDTNSIATIMKHMAGNLRSRFTDFLTTDGEKPNRNRDEEFEDREWTKKQIFADWHDGWSIPAVALSNITNEDLLRSVKIRGWDYSIRLAINESLYHMGYHAGQIVLIAKILRGDTWKVITVPKGGSEEFNSKVWNK